MDRPQTARNGGQRCQATSKQTGKQCGLWAVHDANVCAWHGGRAKQVQAKARARRDEREIRAGMVAFGLPVDGADPGEVLLDEVARAAGVVRWLDEQVRALDPEGLWWGEASHEHGFGPEGVIDKHTEKADTPVVVRVWQEERKHLAQVAALALKAGVEERRVRLAETEALRYAGAFRRVLNGLSLDPEQLRAASEAMVREFRALDTNAIEGGAA